MIFNDDGFIVEEEYVSDEAMAYIIEGAMADLSSEDITMFLESASEVSAAMDDNVLLEKTIIRLDKHAKLSKARKMAIFTVAKEKNDPNFKKLLKVWQMERYLEALLDKKYGNEGMRRARKSVAKAAKSGSNMVKKAANKAKSMFNHNAKVPQKPKELNLKVPTGRR